MNIHIIGTGSMVMKQDRCNHYTQGIDNLVMWPFYSPSPYSIVIICNFSACLIFFFVSLFCLAMIFLKMRTLPFLLTCVFFNTQMVPGIYVIGGPPQKKIRWITVDLWTMLGLGPDHPHSEKSTHSFWLPQNLTTYDKVS